MSEIINAHFAADTSELTGVSASGGGSYGYSGSAGLGGTTGGIAAGLTSGCVAKGWFAYTVWTGKTAGRWQFYFDPNSVSMASAEVHPIARACKANEFDVGTLFVVHSKMLGGQRYLRFDSRDDSGNTTTATDVAITDAEHWVEIHATRSSGPSANDGTVTYYIDTLTSPVASHTGIDNYDQFVLNERFVLGVTGGVDASTIGTVYFDECRINDDGSAIGIGSNPSVTDISNQTGTIGTQKSIACTVADTGADLVRVDVSTDGLTAITLTASGSAVITNNGTQAVYVTGTHADVVATLGNNIALDRADTIYPDFSVVETLTVTATDSFSHTGQDTFTMTWSIATGQGEAALTFTGTYAQALLALPTLVFTPETGVTGNFLMTMVSTTSTPLSDTDDIPIIIIELISSAGIFLPLSTSTRALTDVIM